MDDERQLDIDKRDLDEAIQIGMRAAREKTKWLRIVGGLLIVILIFTGFTAYRSATTERAVAQEQADAGKSLVAEIKAKCESEEKDPDRNELKDLGVCAAAEKAESNIKSTAKPTVKLIPGVPGIPGLNGTNGTDGQDGSNGQDGQNGEDGTDGSNGSDGSDGSDGADGQTGATGAAGQQGPQGEKGDQGETGAAGADAPTIQDILCTGGLAPMTFTFRFSNGTERSVTCGTLDPVTGNEDS